MDTVRVERTPHTSPTHQSRIAFTVSPLLSKGQKKRKRKQKASAEYWSVRTILKEKTVRGEIFYLIDWEDHPDTGESFAPTWVASIHPGQEIKPLILHSRNQIVTSCQEQSPTGNRRNRAGVHLIVENDLRHLTRIVNLYVPESGKDVRPLYQAPLSQRTRQGYSPLHKAQPRRRTGHPRGRRWLRFQTATKKNTA
jgi:hypothetical protein